MGDDITSSPQDVEETKTLLQLFDEVFPYYLSMGMTYDLFWNDRPELVIAYRKAYELQNNRKNQEMWLQGVYVMHSISATVGNMFTKENSKKHTYPDKPLPITVEDYEKQKEDEARKKFESMKQQMILASQMSNNKGGS